MKKLMPLLFTLLCTELFAQVPFSDPGFRKNSIGVSAGIGQVKELNLLPIVHKGVSYGLTYSHFGQAEKSIRLFEVAAGYSELNTRYEGAYASQYIAFGASYAYTFRVHQDEAISFLAGPHVGARYGLGFYPNWDDSHLYWSDYLGLGVSGLLTYKAEKGTWLLNASLPIFSMISRPEKNRQYKIDDVSVGGIIRNMHSRPEPAFWNRNFAVNTGLEYIFPLAQKLSQSVGYAFRYGYMKAAGGSPVYHLHHSLAIKLYF